MENNGLITIGKKVITGVEYFGFQTGLQYIIVRKVTTGSNLVTDYFIGNRISFNVAWAAPDSVPTYSDYGQSAEYINILSLISSSSSSGGAGDASATNQVTGNNSLASIDTKTLTAGQKTMANSSPIVIASDQSPIPTFISDPTSLTKVSVSASGSLSVGLPATTVFSDSLNGTVIDIVNRWNTPILVGSGTVTQNGTSGLIFTNSTTANNAGQISSQPTFDISGAIQYVFALGVQLETTTMATGNHRFFGLGNQGTSYSTTNPIKEGVGFEITTAGVLRAVIYSADAVTFSQNLTIPIDGNEHLYGVFFLGNYIFWYIDQFSIPVAVSGLLQPSNTVLPIRLHSLNGVSTTVGTPIFNAFSMAIVDSTRNGTNITDGTYGWRKASVSATGELSIKALGLPASLGQNTMANSLSVVLSSNQSTLPVMQQDVAASGNITTQNLNATGTGTVGSFIGYTTLNAVGSVSFQVTGTYTGALTPQFSNDGTNWITPSDALIKNIGTSVYATTVTSGTIGIFAISLAGFLFFRMVALAAVTGTAVITMRGSSVISIVELRNSASTIGNIGQITGPIQPGSANVNLGKAEDAAHGSGDIGVASLLLRNDTLTSNTNATADYILPTTDQYGAQYVKNVFSAKRTYSTSFTVVPAATATDIFQLIGSASTSVQITRIIISGVQTTAGNALVLIQKRSTANSAGTQTAPTLVPHISADVAATAVGAVYTANPTPGTSIGNIYAEYVPIGSTTITTNKTIIDFAEKGKPIVLTGVAQAIAISLNGATLTGGTLAIRVEFTEE